MPMKSCSEESASASSFLSKSPCIWTYVMIGLCTDDQRLLVPKPHARRVPIELPACVFLTRMKGNKHASMRRRFSAYPIRRTRVGRTCQGPTSICPRWSSTTEGAEKTLTITSYIPHVAIAIRYVPPVALGRPWLLFLVAEHAVVCHTHRLK